MRHNIIWHYFGFMGITIGVDLLRIEAFGAVLNSFEKFLILLSVGLVIELIDLIVDGSRYLEDSITDFFLDFMGICSGAAIVWGLKLIF